MKPKAGIAIIGTILISLVGVLWMAVGSRPAPAKLTYSQFLERVHTGQVASVVIHSDSGPPRVTSRLKDGATVQTVLPSDYRDALLAMQDQRVDIEIRNPPSGLVRFLLNATPFFLLLGVWAVLMWRNFPNGPRCRIPR